LERAVKVGDPAAYREFVRRYRGGLPHFRACQASSVALERLRIWFPETWLEERRKDFRKRTIAAEKLRRLGEAIPRLSAYQAVRRRLSSAADKVLECLKVLRSYEAALQAVPSAKIPATVRATLAREARLAWKDRLESERPSLLLDRESLLTRVQRLGELDEQFLKLNRDLLAASGGRVKAPGSEAWQAITRLTGPQARRLREFFELGLEMGLLGLRPVWLMNPDVASRLLPLRAGLFDVVVFDEASQIPVEHALPALYRAKRAVVSGDEKQMPPTSFFISRLDSDEDELFDADEIDDAVTETERAALEEKRSRREIKDCEDLLTLARNCLPQAMLEIHYRSNFRELIDFSNAAYYGGNLYVPVQKPEGRVKRDRPIIVQRINGCYKSQVNEAEAAAVVDLVARIWQDAGNRRPSLGVVTFNRKQADLISDRLEERAEKDAEFRRVMAAESQRKQEGEDMSFFVKNVENVQGDERDVVVFSTTFGRNESGVFRRTFGVLGQQGGERRLNVAVTRARDKVILVTSMPIAEISDMLATGRPPGIARDYLQSYMDYASKVSDGELANAREVAAKCRLGLGPDNATGARENVDGFVLSVGEFLKTLSVKAHPTGDGLFGLDFAVEHPQSGGYALGIECDGPTHGLLRRARARDIWRAEVLRRSMPKIHRVSSHAWLHDADHERERLAQAVQSVLATAAAS
jgi:primosomal replication protein N''